MIALALLLAAAGGPDTLPERLPGAELVALDGERLALESLGGQRLVLAFVRPGQDLSERVLVDLEAEREHLARSGVQVLAIADDGEGSEAWPAALERLALGFPLVLDPRARLRSTLLLERLPVTLVVDEAARITSSIPLHRSSFRRDLGRRLERARTDEEFLRREHVERAASRGAAMEALRAAVRLGARPQVESLATDLRRTGPEDLELSLGLGRALLEVGSERAAATDLARARELAPDSLRARLWHALALAPAEQARARADLESLAALVPEGWRVLARLGEQDWAAGRQAEALATWRAALGRPAAIWVEGLDAPGRAPQPRVLDLEGREVYPTIGPGPRCLVLFWNHSAPGALDGLRALQALAARASLAIEPVAIAVEAEAYRSVDVEAVRAACRAAGLEAEPWLDDEQETRDLFGVRSLPTAVLVDERGGVAARFGPGRMADLATAVRARLREADAAVVSGPAPEEIRGPFPRVTDDDRTLNMAHHLARQGRIEGARRVALSRPEALVARENELRFVARLELELGLEDEARAHLEAVPEAERGPAWSVLCAALRERAGDLDGARAELERALAQERGDAPALRALGRVAAATGRIEEAREHLRAAVAHDPLSEDGWALLGGVLAELGDLPGARSAFQAALDLRGQRESFGARRAREGGRR